MSPYGLEEEEIALIIDGNRITNYIQQYTKHIEIPAPVLATATSLANTLYTYHPYFISGKSSSALAASCIYIAAILKHHLITQTDLSHVLCDGMKCKVSTVAIRNNYKAIVELLSITMDSQF